MAAATVGRFVGTRARLVGAHAEPLLQHMVAIGLYVLKPGFNGRSRLQLSKAKWGVFNPVSPVLITFHLSKLSRRARSVQRRDEPLAATTAPLTALLARFRCAAPSRTHPEATDPRGSRMSSCGCRGVCLSEPCQTAVEAGGISDSPVASPVCRPALCLHDRRSPAGLEGSLRTRAVPPPSGPPASALSPSRSRIGT